MTTPAPHNPLLGGVKPEPPQTLAVGGDTPKPMEARPLGSQESQLHADPRAVAIVEDEKKAKLAALVIPLKPGDVVQGPGDRRNRKPNEKELEAGKNEYQYHLTPEEQEVLNSQKFTVIDPPIDKNAPKDVPADPRKVAESRGIKFPDKDPGVLEPGKDASLERFPKHAVAPSSL